MDHTHPHGKSISILSFSESKEVIVDNKELEKIFNHSEIQERKAVILSLIGAFRGGKSFFLDYCLRFLYVHFPSINNRSKSTQSYFRKDDNWMGNPDEPLKGFSWRSGAKRETIGINIWSDVFLHTMDRTGEKIAIFVMDTQGLFDNESTPTDNSRIFALGTLISSIQVLNLKQQIQEDQLQYLQFATEFAQFNAKKKGKFEGKPFQNLTFLIRDWQNFDDYEFGANGGKRYFEEEVLKIKPTHAPELRSVREFVRNSFEEIECCLLPYPGMDVAGSKNYDGRWSKMDEKFRIELKNVIEHLLLPENMTLKKLNSQKLAVKEVKIYVEKYLNLFQSGEIPKTPTLYQFILDSNMGNLIKKCVDQYKAGINNDTDLKNEESIPIVHKKWKSKAMKIYDDEDKMGDSQQQDASRSQLDQKLEENYNEFKNIHEQMFRELRREAERHRIQLEAERRKKEQAERERRQKEAELKEAREKMERDAKIAREERERERREAADERERERREATEERKRQEQKQREQAERDRVKIEADAKKATAELERKLNEIKEKHDEERNTLKQQLDEEKSSVGHFLGKVVKGAGLAVASPFVTVGGEVAVIAAMAKGAIEDGNEGARRNGQEAYDATLGAWQTTWEKWWKS